jgi:hypothetical protein
VAEGSAATSLGVANHRKRTGPVRFGLVPFCSLFPNLFPSRGSAAGDNGVSPYAGGGNRTHTGRSPRDFKFGLALSGNGTKRQKCTPGAAFGRGRACAFTREYL